MKKGVGVVVASIWIFTGARYRQTATTYSVTKLDK